MPLILISLGKSERFVNDHQDKYNYIFHKILEGRVIRRNHDADAFTQLNLRFLEKFLGGRYANDILKELMNLDLLQCDGQYIIASKEQGIKGKSLGYRIHPDYVSKSTLRMVFKTETWDVKIAKQRAAYRQSNPLTTSMTWRYLTMFRIHEKQAVAYIDAKLNNMSAWLSPMESELSSWSVPALTVAVGEEGKKRFSIEDKEYKKDFLFYYESLLSRKVKELEGKGVVYSLMNTHLMESSLYIEENQRLNLYTLLVNNVINQYDADLSSIQKIVTEDFFIEQPDPSSRVYTNLSNLNHDLRQFLYHRKFTSNLVNLDIRNSQPYLFSLLLTQRYEDQHMPEDACLYIRLTANGSFYEYIMDLLDISMEQRGAFKIRFFGRVFFCTTHYSKRTPEGRLFQRHFPNVYALVNQYKATGYEQLAIQMQRAEAGIILGTIATELIRNRIWHGTIHDSIVVMTEHAEAVKLMILEAFTVVVGIPPSIKVEQLTSCL